MTKISNDIIAQHGLSQDEYDKICTLIAREPNIVELGIFSAMWNEHCSYKSSKLWLKTLHTEGEHVICGPGENAGIIDIGEGLAVVFKMESHNHPSFIEPYQGAATGVGGILRDIFTMGARPVASLNALFFGSADHHLTPKLLRGVVAGIGGYGNAFGVPTVGGSVTFNEGYNNNILVNAMAVGIVEKQNIFYAAASEIGRQVVYIGAKTGRDGIHGATMASASFGEDAAELRPTVQVGDPFCEKRLLEATLELMQAGCVEAIQDMGAAGLTCSAVEMGAKGNMGVRLQLDQVPQREPNMSAYEMMLSESQERMLLIMTPGKEAHARKILQKWELDFAIVGETIAEKRFELFHHGEMVADLPIKELGDEAPEYDRPYSQPPSYPDYNSDPKIDDLSDVLLKMLSHPNLASRRPIYTQYDHLVGGQTILRPGQADAALVGLEGTTKGLAISTDVTPRYCALNPRLGAMQAVVETYRNISAVGAKPLAVTDNLNFGNPQRPEIMAQFVEAIKGIDAACRALEYPVVSGNVSLYNETDEKSIPPTPTIGGVGLLEHLQDAVGLTASKDVKNAHIILIGGRGQHLGGSMFVTDIQGQMMGPPPRINFDDERRHGEFVRQAIRNQLVLACHDVSDGGLAICLAELSLANNVGLQANIGSNAAALFGEDQARYVLIIDEENICKLDKMAKEQHIPFEDIGTMGHDTFTLSGHGPISVGLLREAHEQGLHNVTGVM